MDKFFDNKWALRITALVLSILFFVYAKSEQDNVQSTAPSSEVDIITQVPLEAYYDTENLIVTGLPKTVDVTLEGPRQIVLKAKLTKDFKVFVDLNSLLIGEHRVEIQHENFSDKLDITIDPHFVNVVIEEKVTEEVRVDPEMNTGLIASDYELKGMTVKPDTVLVTGAKSIIESIEYVKATVTAERNTKSSFEQEASVKVLDRNLNKLDVLIKPETVNVKVEISAFSKEVPIKLIQKGTPKEGVTINNISSETKNIKVFGQKTFIDEFNELVVEFDVSDIEESGTYEVKLVIPTGATRLSSETIKVQADVTMTSTETEQQTTAEETNTNEINRDTEEELEE